jgi:hypothetical protein
MMEVAIFGCNSASPADIQTPGTTCYRIMALGAPAEWLYALTTVAWSLAIAFDVYTSPVVGRIKAEQDEAEMRLLGADPLSPQSPETNTGFDSDDKVMMKEVGPSRSRSWRSQIGMPRKNEMSRMYRPIDPVTGITVEEEDEAEHDLGLATRVRNMV